MPPVRNMVERPLEATVALYIFAVGFMFVTRPDMLASGAYRAWHEFGQAAWGYGMVFVAFLHFSALWLNGAAPQLSRPIRLAAVLIHMGICFEFALMFLEGGSIWGAFTYGLFFPLVLILIGRRVMRRFLHGGSCAEL